MSAIDATVTVFKRVNKPRGTCYDATLGAVLERVRTGAYAEAIAAVRAEADPERRKALKRTRLLALAPSGQFHRRDASGLVAHSGIVVIDLDHAPDLDALRADVTARPYVAAAFVSPSGDGLKVFVPVAVVDPTTGEVRAPRDDAEHKAAWATVAARLDSGAARGLIDPSGKDVARACYLSHDPTVYVNEGAETVVVDLTPPPPYVPPRMSRPASTDRDLARLESALEHVGRAGRLPYPEWVKLIAAVLDAVRGDAAGAEALLVRYVGEETPGEYAAKLASPTDREVTAASLYYLAQDAGWQDTLGSRSSRRERDRDRTARASAGSASPPADVPLGVCLADVEATAIRWAWPGWLALGKIHVFDGNPGAGKSTLLAGLAACVTTGARWPDGEPVPDEARGGVVILTAEDDPATTIRPRMEAAGADVARVSVVVTVPSGDGRADDYGRIPSFPLDVPLIMGECRRVGARLLVVDPVTAYLGDVNSHRDSDVRGALAPLAAAAEEAGVAVVLVRHLNKGAGGSALYRGGGSIAFAGLARVVWIVGTDPEQPTRRALAVSKNNLAAYPPTLGYDLESAGPFGVGRVVWTGVLPLTADDLVRPAATTAPTPAQDAAAEWLADALADGDRLARELYAEAESAGIAEATLKRAKGRLGVTAEKRGGFDSGGWYWSLGASPAPKGIKAPVPDPLRETPGDGATGIAPHAPRLPKGITPVIPLNPVIPFEGDHDGDPWEPTPF